MHLVLGKTRLLVAPVIVNGELTTGLGGGVCQVSTTVFNTAFDAGLKITASVVGSGVHGGNPIGVM